MVRQIFNEIMKESEFTREAWKKVKIKAIDTRRDAESVGKLPDLLIASVVQTVHDNIVQQNCIHDSPKNKRKIRRDSEAHTRQQIILRRTE